MLRQRELPTGFDEGNHAVKVWPGMGTGDDDPNRMKEILALGSSSLFHFVDNCFEAFRRESITALTYATCKFGNHFASYFRRKQWLIVFGLNRCFRVIAQQELGLFGELP